MKKIESSQVMHIQYSDVLKNLFPSLLLDGRKKVRKHRDEMMYVMMSWSLNNLMQTWHARSPNSTTKTQGYIEKYMYIVHT